MTLRLAIENMDRLPDGGPVQFEVTGRGFDIGRDAHLDWTLPDPERHVSSKHCEVRFRDGGYWLTDVSTNGTFVNGASQRLNAPYRLRDGDRLTIGRYIIGVSVRERSIAAAPSMPAAPPPPFAPAAPAGMDVWGSAGEAAPPEDRAAFRPRAETKSGPDFLDFAAPLAPAAPLSPAFEAPAPTSDAWLNVRPARPEPPAPPPPAPRRPAPPPVQSQPSPAPPAAQPPPPKAEVKSDVFDVAATAPPPLAEGEADVLARILAAAGVPSGATAGKDPFVVADEIGAILRLTAQNLAQMLASRAETKSLIRSSSRTMIRALENNPLKFMATPEEALGVMLGGANRNYLDARRTIETSFEDLKKHQVLTYGAMQAALEALFDDFAPERIDKSVEPERGLGALMASRKAKLWDVYVERWRAKTKRSDGRLSEAFMDLFAQAYDRLQNKGA